jgi:hypothetical protein
LTQAPPELPWLTFTRLLAGSVAPEHQYSTSLPAGRGGTYFQEVQFDQLDRGLGKAVLALYGVSSHTQSSDYYEDLQESQQAARAVHGRWWMRECPRNRAESLRSLYDDRALNRYFPHLFVSVVSRTRFLRCIGHDL